MRTLVWFRGKDLRLCDHAPLASALAGGEVLPVFVLDPYFFAPERARRTRYRIQFLLESIAELGRAIEARGSRLLLVEGKSHEVLPELVRQFRAERVVAQAWTWPIGRERDRRVREALDVSFDTFEGETLLAPGSVRGASGAPYNVYGPFARAFARDEAIADPLPAPRSLPPLPPEIDRDPLGRAVLPTLTALGIEHQPRIQPGGERAGRARLETFSKRQLGQYHRLRDRLDVEGTSRLSCDLKFGTVSVREVWSNARGRGEGRARFRSEIVWREFAYDLLWHRPELLVEPFQTKFQGLPWREDERAWRAWVAGETGYPVVDASARQLLAEGFVPNRARMISASFLTKHLLIDFRRGERHYIDWLTDGDEANNDAGWQWVAGCGCDAQPYFRIFNPVAQGKKFDPEGTYVRRWLPELGRVPAQYVHEPWAAPAGVLEQAGVVLGRNYPHPLVEHRAARQRFLDTARAHFGG